MDLSWLESTFYGFVIGLTDILPISAQAHRLLLIKLYGIRSDHAGQKSGQNSQAEAEASPGCQESDGPEPLEDHADPRDPQLFPV